VNPLFEAARELQTVCEGQAWQFCFIGGVAVQRWGQPRFTADADLTLITGFGREESFVDHLLLHFRPRRPDAVQFALRNRVLLIENSAGIPLDVALGAIAFEIATARRATPFVFPTGHSLLTCSAEDLIVHKCFAGRDQDWLDVGTVLARQQGKLDLELIRRELKPLAELKEAPEIVDRLEGMIAKWHR